MKVNENRRQLNEMPFDKAFDTEYGYDQLCHATGFEVLIDGQWWNEYKDESGELYYGR